MNVEISNQYEGGQFIGTNATYKIQGDFRKEPSDGKVINISSSVNAVDGDIYIGNVHAYLSGDELRYNLNDIAIEHLAGVVTAVSELVANLETNE